MQWAVNGTFEQNHNSNNRTWRHIKEHSWIQIWFYNVLHVKIKLKLKKSDKLTDSKAWSGMQVCCDDCDDSLTRLWLSGRLRLHSLSNRNWHCSNKEFTNASLVKIHCIHHALKTIPKMCNSKKCSNSIF